jgi:exonuclease III
LWDAQQFNLTSWDFDLNWLLVSLLHVPSGKSFNILNVYMPSLYRDKVICWNSLMDLQRSLDSPPIIVVGDFNTTLHAFEKRGGSIVEMQTREHMEDLIQTWDLVDVKPQRGRFTWSNKRQGDGHITARLDMIFNQ